MSRRGAGLALAKWAAALLLAMIPVGVTGTSGCRRATPVASAPQPPINLPSGLVYQVLVPGGGDEATKGDKVTVHYVGAFVDGGIFDSSRQRGAPFKFWVGERQVIEGWDEGVLGMKEGEVRKLTIPPALGYGGAGNAKVPGNATLVFEVELLDVR
jgi:FKBP-type peptidyl-prolyl cis-trans isomerase